MSRAAASAAAAAMPGFPPRPAATTSSRPSHNNSSARLLPGAALLGRGWPGPRLKVAICDLKRCWFRIAVCCAEAWQASQENGTVPRRAGAGFIMEPRGLRLVV